EDLTQVVVRLCVIRIDGNRLAERLCGEIPFLLEAEQHAVVVVSGAKVDTKSYNGVVVLLCLLPVPRAAVQTNQIGMGFGQGRLLNERRFVRRDGGFEIARLGELHPAPDVGLRIVAQSGNGGEDRVVQRGPARSVLLMPLERTLRLVSLAKRAIRQRQRVVSGAKFWKELDRAQQVRDSDLVM